MIKKKLLKNTHSPLVSICIPVFNAELYISRAISSCLNQTYKDIEIIVIDNNSNDKTFDEILKFKSEKVKVIKNPINIGITENFNVCLNESNGEFIKFVCADDYLESTCVEKMVNEMILSPDSSMAICQRVIIDLNEDILGLISYKSSALSINQYEVINNCLFSGNLIGEPTATLFRKEIALRGFNKKYKHLLDLEMWFFLLENGPMINITEPLCYIRRHSEQATYDSIRSGALIHDNLLLFKEYYHKPYINKSILMKSKWILIYVYRYIRYSILKNAGFH